MIRRTFTAALFTGAWALSAAGGPAHAFLDKLDLGFGGEETTFLTVLQKDQGVAQNCGGDGMIAARLANVDYGLGVVRDPALNAYVADVLKRVMSVSPAPNCRITVSIIPNADLTTVATADGGIILPLGLLRELKSEDELAAILAHEASHILFRHHESDTYLETQDDLMKGVDSIYGASALFADMTGGTVGRNLNAARAVGGSVYQVSESVIAPAWTQEQEDEADLLGTDLLAEADYNPTAMGRIMDILAAYEKIMEEGAKAREAMREEQFRNQMYGSMTDPETASGALSGDTATLLTVGAQAVSGLLSLTETDSHRPAAERKQQVTEYVRKYHGKTRRRKFDKASWEAALTAGETGAVLAAYQNASEARRIALSEGELDSAEAKARAAVTGPTKNAAYPRLAFYEVRNLQGEKGKAGQNLDIALADRTAPWSVYRNRATLHAQSGNRGEAIKLVEQANQAHGDPLTIIPFALSLYKQEGDEEKIASLLARCQAEGTREFVQSCNAAAGKTGETTVKGATDKNGNAIGFSSNNNASGTGNPVNELGGALKSLFGN